MRPIDQNIKEIKDNLFASNIKEAIARTRELVADHPDRSFEHRIILISSQYEELQRARQEATVSYEGYTVELSKISKQLLSFLEDISQSVNTSEPPVGSSTDTRAGEKEKGTQVGYVSIVGETKANQLRFQGGSHTEYFWWVPVSGIKIDLFFENSDGSAFRWSRQYEVDALGPYEVSYGYARTKVVSYGTLQKDCFRIRLRGCPHPSEKPILFRLIYKKENETVREIYQYYQSKLEFKGTGDLV